MGRQASRGRTSYRGAAAATAVPPTLPGEDPIDLDDDVAAVPTLAPRDVRALQAFGLGTVRALLTHYPHPDRYRETGRLTALADATLAEPVTVVGTLDRWRVERARARRGLTIARAEIVDRGGDRVEAAWFNQPWRAKQVPEGTAVAVAGTLERFRGRLQVKNATLTRLEDTADVGALAAGRITATYPASEALASHRIARAVDAALEALPPLADFLPAGLRARHDLVTLDAAVRGVHLPSRLSDVTLARRRLVYDELLCLQVALAQRRVHRARDLVGLAQAPRAGGLAERLLDALPFPPTAAQQRATAEIAADLGRDVPMHRLLQGDVGSGKTIVAAWTLLAALEHGRQAVLMAPTEVLAEQHLQTFSTLLAPLGAGMVGGPRIGLLTGGLSTAQRRRVLAELAVGDLDLLIGTHALLEQPVDFADLGVVVVDEQHRFGVEHRRTLRDKRRDGHAPDVLVMTATPIPRSLALTVYGDLDVTVLDELPPGRTPVTTQVIERDSPRRAKLYDYIAERAAHGERAYVVCPLVEDSEAISAASAVTMHAHLAGEVFPQLRVGLLHGRLPAEDKDTVMDAFRRGELDVLVATTVIEVGLDVPEASVMIVEDAERFGLSQLHQLRGRVGRGAARSFCVLFSADAEDNPRLAAVAGSDDGFALAETDLELRGEGSLFATRQWGMGDLALARLTRDLEVIAASRSDARELVEADPDLTAHPALAAEVDRRYGDGRLDALETG